MAKQALTVLMGVPGSGKSTLAESFDVPVVSLDAIRVGGRSASHVVNAAVRDVEQILADGRSVLVDSCNLQPQIRLRWLRAGRKAGARCELIVVETDRDLAIVRNRSRPERERVPDDAMLRYVARWPDARNRARGEGWDRIRVVSGGEPLLGVRSREW